VLSVRSGPFSGDVDFYFEGFALDRFIADLQVIDTSLRGRARLKLEFEEPFIELEGDGLGHVLVRGLLLSSEAQRWKTLKSTRSVQSTGRLSSIPFAMRLETTYMVMQNFPIEPND